MKTIQIFRYGFILPFLMLFLKAFSADESLVAISKGDRVRSGISIVDPRYANIESASWSVNGSKTTITLGVDQYTVPATAGIQDITLNIRVKYYNKNKELTVLPSASGSIQLSVKYDPSQTASPVNLKDQDIIVLDNAYNVTVDVVSMLPAGTLGDFIYLKAEMHVERYYTFDVSSIPYTADRTLLNRRLLTPSNELEIYWADIDGAEDYDLEYMFVDNFDQSLNAERSQVSLQYDFRNSTRVTQSSNSYRIPILNDHGYMIYRVRGVGKKIITTNGISEVVRMYGAWSSDYEPKRSEQNPFNTLDELMAETHKYYIPWNTLSNINAQATATFAEEGKRNDVLTFYDGSLRNRQTVTKDNSNNKLVVQETFYDHQGRGVIQTLPAPYAAPSADVTGKGYLWYKQNFNINAAGQAYSKSDFNIKTGEGQCDPIKPAAMAENSGSAKYYSSSNGSDAAKDSYIPSANGYPFIQTEYTPDNTNRIRTQGGVGEDFQLGAHATKYIYSQPIQEELDRILGSEAGYSEHYKKNVVIDPNGQASVSYLNLSGKTIATSLSGLSPTNLTVLPGQQIKSLKASIIESCVTPPCPLALTDKNALIDNAMVASQDFAVVYPGTYTFSYDLLPNYFKAIDQGIICENTEVSGSICYDCIYDLVLEVRDECGDVKSVVAETIGSAAGSYTCSSPGLQTKSMVVALDPGAYKLTKRLVVNESALNNYVNNFINTNQCIKITDQDIADEKLNLFPPGQATPCEESDCKTCLSSLNFSGDIRDDINYQANLNQGMTAYNNAHPDFTFTTLEDYKNEIENCKELCEPLNMCQAGLGMMEGDVSPDGQYGATTSDNAGWMLSVFNPGNLLPQNLKNGPNGNANYRHPSQPYADVNGPSYIILEQLDDESFIPSVTGSVLDVDVFRKKRDGNDNWLDAAAGDPEAVWVTKPENLSKLSDFLEVWQPGWEKSLVTYHPEYCYYDFCVKNTVLIPGFTYTSEDFNTRVQELENYSDAISVQGSASLFYDARFPAALFTTEDIFASNKFIPNFLSDKDPFFATGGEGANAKTEMQGIMSNYQNSNLSLAAFVRLTLTCGTLYHASAANLEPCTELSGFLSWTDDEKQNFWKMFSTLYLSEKQKIQSNLSDKYCSGDCNNANPYIGNNFCIGNTKYNPYGGGGRRGTIWTAFREFPCQPCNWYTYRYYSGLTKRFISDVDQNANLDICSSESPEEQLSSMKNKVELELYLKTGQCPVLRDLGFLLSDLANNPDKNANDVLTTDGAQINPRKYVSFTQNLYDNIVYNVPNTSNSGYINQTLTNAFTFANQKWTAHISFAGAGNAGCGTTEVVLPEHIDAEGLISFNFLKNTPGYTEITNFHNLSGAGTGSPAGYFAFTAVADIDYYLSSTSTKITYQVPVTGNTCLPIQNCSAQFTNICVPSQEATDMGSLLSAMASNKHLNISTYVQLNDRVNSSVPTSANNYYNLFTGAIEKYLPASSGISQNWYFKSSTISDVTTINFYSTNSGNPENQMTIRIERTGGESVTDITKLVAFSCVRTVPGNTTNFKLTGWYNTSGTEIVYPEYSVSVSVAASRAGNFVASRCGPPVQEECNTQAHRNAKGIQYFLSDLVGNGRLSANTILVEDNVQHAIPVSNYFYNELAQQLDLKNEAVLGNVDISGDLNRLSAEILGVPESVPCTTTCVKSLGSITLEFIETGIPFSSIVDFTKLIADYSQSSSQTRKFSIDAIYNVGGTFRTTRLHGSSNFSVATCQSQCLANKEELVTNGDFSDTRISQTNAHQGTGFFSDNNLKLKSGIQSGEGRITNNAGCVNYAGCSGQTIITCTCNIWQGTGRTNNDYFLAIDEAGIQRAWYTTIPAANVHLGETYVFSYYALNLRTDNSASPMLRMDITNISNSTRVNVLTSSATTISSINWMKVEVYWTSTLDNVPIEIAVVYTDGTSQSDLGLDDISFSKQCRELNNQIFPEVVLDPEVNPCEEYLNDVAQSNAEIKNERSKELAIQDIRKKYIAHCLSAAENLSFTYPSVEHHFTLYYYDQAGNLTKTIPPNGVKVLDQVSDAAKFNQIKVDRESGGTYTATAQPAHSMATAYEYNSLNQLMRQNTPDAGTSYFWYDELGRMVLSRNSKQEADGSAQNKSIFSYTLYDNLNRISEVGQFPFTSGAPTFYEQIKYTDFYSIVTSSLEKDQVTKTYYDLPSTAISLQGFTQENLRKRVSYTTYDDDQDGLYDHGTFYSYDIHGNVKTVVQDFALAARKGVIDADNRYKKIDYNYDLISGKVNMVSYQLGKNDQFFHKYRYDASNKLTHACTSTDGVRWENDARYEYYDHGPLARSEVGDLKVQGMDYAYTLQGWLKGMNSNSLSPANDQGRDADGSLAGNLNKNISKDVVGLTLNYFTNDYSPIGTSSFIATASNSDFGTNQEGTQLYNGNINAVVTTLTKTGLMTSQPQAPIGTSLALGAVYRYDQLNRIIDMKAFENFSASQNKWLSGGLLQDPYYSNFMYDANGNLQTAIRSTENGSLANDQINYEYTANSNRLAKVTGSLSSDYVYDPMGNLITDISSGISIIDWSISNKIRNIIKSAAQPANESFQYDASGNRIAKIIKPHVTNSSAEVDSKLWTYQYYVRDAGGNVMAIYQASPDNSATYSNFRLIELPLYGSSRLGQFRQNMLLYKRYIGTGTPPAVTPDADLGYRSYSRSLSNKYYEISNHLGNVLSVVSDRRFRTGVGESSTFTADIWSVSDYYPFGYKMARRSIQRMTAEDNGTGYRYGFNGKEQDFSVAQEDGRTYDYGFRIYDARIGRFLSTDPLAIKYPDLSPYSFVANTPLQAIDPDGRLVIFVNGFRISRLLERIIFGKLIGKLFDDKPNQVYSYDRYQYWGGIDQKFKTRIKDNKALYADGHNDANSTAAERYQQGKAWGNSFIEKVASGEIVLKQGETIKIISHSQGAAYAAGIVDAINSAPQNAWLKEVFKFETAYNIAPKQGGDIKLDVERVVQFGGPNDIIAHQYPLQEVDENVPYPISAEKGPIDEHLLGNYNWIFKLKSNERGYVAPRKDIKIDEK